MGLSRLLAGLCAGPVPLAAEEGLRAAEPGARPATDATSSPAQTPHSSGGVQTQGAVSAASSAASALASLQYRLSGIAHGADRPLALLGVLADCFRLSACALYASPALSDSSNHAEPCGLVALSASPAPPDVLGHLYPTLHQASIFARVVAEKVPVTIIARARDCNSAQHAHRVAAVPLLHGGALAGILWMEHNVRPQSGSVDAALPFNCGALDRGRLPPVMASESGGSGTRKLHAAGSDDAQNAMQATEQFLADPKALSDLGFACTMSLLGAEADALQWLASALSRLGDAASLLDVLCALTDTLAAHVERRFVLESTVNCALVPRRDAAVGLLLRLHPQPSATQAPTSRFADSETRVQAPLHGSARVLAACGGDVPVHASAGSPMQDGAGALSWRHLARPPTGTSGPHTGGEGPHAATGDAPPGRGSLLSVDVVCQPGDAGAAGAAGGIAPHPLSPTTQRHALSSGAAARVAIKGTSNGTAVGLNDLLCRTASGMGGGGGAVSSRSVVIPLAPGEVAAVPALSAAGLHAKAFQLQQSLVHSVLLRQARPERERAVRRDAASGRSGGSAENIGGSTWQHVAVVEDVARFVQDVHRPSRDVAVLLDERRVATMAGPTSAGGWGTHTSVGSGGAIGPAGGAGHSGSFSAAGGAAGGRPVSALGMCGVSPRGSAGHTGGYAAGPVQSLVLLTVPVEEGGASLVLYCCFSRRLPATLLEAVQSSAQELLDVVLAPLLRCKLRSGAIAAELDTLRAATPGSYAVFSSPSTTGMATRPSLRPGDASAVSTLNELAFEPPTSASHTMTTTTAAQPELLSAILSTADMDALMVGGGDAAHTATASGGGAAPAVQAARLTSQGLGRAGSRMSDAVARGRHLSPSMDRSQQNAHATKPNSPRSCAARLAAASTAGRRTGLLDADAGVAASSAAGGAQQGAPLSEGAAGGMGRRSVGAAVREEALEAVSLNQLLHTASRRSLVQVAPQSSSDLLTSQARMPTVTALSEGLAAGLTPTIITVAGVDAASTAAQRHMDLLFNSVQATLSADPSAHGSAGAPAASVGAHLEDLDHLELAEVLGRGGGGIVFRGRLNGSMDVAVKLMELPALDADPPTQQQPQQQPQQQQQQEPAAAAGSNGRAAATQAGRPTAAAAAAVLTAEKAQLKARREMLRSAMELGVQSRVSHPTIVQIYATYPNVVLRTRQMLDRATGNVANVLRLLPAPSGDAPPPPPAARGSGPRRDVPCVAAVCEWCDRGSLAAALSARAFPPLARRTDDGDGMQRRSLQGIAGAALPTGSASPTEAYDMKAVYMTLLDVAMALRHLHAMHLVHRDLKPANLLLKSAPRDHRGFTVKLADFGFVLPLDQIADDGRRYTIADQACGTVTHMAPEALLGAGAKIDSSVDIYSFGILMSDLFAGGLRPFPQVKPERIPALVYKGARPVFLDGVPLMYRSLATACWNTDPQRRPTAKDLVATITGLLQELDG